MFVSCNYDAPQEVETIVLTKSEEQITNGINQFTIDYYKRAYLGSKDLFVSPLSLSITLAMVANGSGTQTQEQINRAIGVNSHSMTETNIYFQKIIGALPKLDYTTELIFANSIWVDKKYSLNSGFSSMTKKYYEAIAQGVDFTKESALRQVNEWCSTNTKGKISNLFSSIEQNTKIMVVNALYFRGHWQMPFMEDATIKDTPFTSLDGTISKVEMMNQYQYFGYCQDEIFQVIEMPYGNDAFSMVVLLPHKDVSFDKAIESLSVDKLEAINNSLVSTEVKLFMPKFQIDMTFDCAYVLQGLGITDAFDPMLADFSFITNSSEPVTISTIMQKTSLIVNETGSEAAVSSATILRNASPDAIEGRSPEFKADRPFIFLIKERSAGTILFIGQKG
ncbi:MAG: serpin family protein [Bacteroidales bacterium]|nr:serpin family protein [Bacteroidales bacterium]